MKPKNSTNLNDSDQPFGDDRQMASVDFESFDEFQSVISLAKSAVTVEPPKGFTQNVMSRIGAADPNPNITSNWNRLKFGFKNLTLPASGTEIAFCYFLAGFFYLVLGAVSYIGLKHIDPRMSMSVWIMFQPQIALATAAGLVLMGCVLFKVGEKAFRIVYSGTIVYLLFSLFNGIRIHETIVGPFQLPAILCFVGGSVILCLFLATILHRYRRQIQTSPAIAGR